MLNWQSSTWNNVMERVLEGSILERLLMLIHIKVLDNKPSNKSLTCIKINNGSRMEP